MPSKRLNIMLYSANTGEQIVLPVNPETMEIKYNKNIETYNILGFGEVNIMGETLPLKITFSHFLPEDSSELVKFSSILYKSGDGIDYYRDVYSLRKVTAILQKWAQEKILIRLVVDDEINIQCFVLSFADTIRENTVSRPCQLELIEYRNPARKTKTSLGLYARSSSIAVPQTILMKSNDTVYSLSDKYGLDYKLLAANNNIKDANASMAGTILVVGGAKKQ